MHDIRAIRENPDAFEKGMMRRCMSESEAKSLSETLLALDADRRAIETRAQEIQTERNKAAKEIGQLKAKGEDASAQIELVAKSKAEQAEAELEAKEKAEALKKALEVIPNIPADDVPQGATEDDNIEVRTWGDPRKFDFDAREHFDLGEALGQMDFETAAKMSGARFVVLTGALARMERALANFMLDLQTSDATENLGGYTETNPPALVKDNALYGTGQLPKFSEDLFKTKQIDEDKKRSWINEQLDLRVNQKLPWKSGTSISVRKPESEEVVSKSEVFKIFEEINRDADNNPEFENPLWLIPTAEVPLTNLVAGETLAEADLPKRNTAMTWCFRSEAGAAGKDTRGMIRQHQFTKVEMVSVVKPEDSEAELDRMTNCAEEVLRRLELPFRTVMLCTGDLGFGAVKTFDIEVWLPGQGQYREISSCSNTRDFQARRMNARFKRKDAKKPEFVHTLNGSGLAVGRTLIAVMENYQNSDGTITVPEALRPYMGGLEVIG